MEEGQPGSPKGSNRTGNPATGTLSWQGFQERDPAGYRKLVTSVMRDDFTIKKNNMTKANQREGSKKNEKQ